LRGLDRNIVGGMGNGDGKKPFVTRSMVPIPSLNSGAIRMGHAEVGEK